MPQIVSTVLELRRALAALRPGRIGMVPTMGALHAGHVSLVTETKKHAEHVVVSIFVNPAQFAPHEDFDAYPRTLDADLAKLGDAAAIVFAPTAREMYRHDHATTVTVAGGPAAGLETDFRPHFLAGAATVVVKLLIAASPDVAVFGEKDYQQLLVVKQLARDLALPTQILSAPTLREADGLAMSSRNIYLSAKERAVAAQLNVILKEAAALAATDLRGAEAAGPQALKRVGFERVDYVAIRDSETLAPIMSLERPARILAAAWLGKTRLIDNIAI